MENSSLFFSKQNYFFKWHGTGNDFIIVNGIQRNGKLLTRQKSKNLAQRLCHRKFGIGADGLLIVREVQGVYKMQVINSDGSQPNMCGNGLRCFVAFLYHQKMITQSYEVLTDDGAKSVRIERQQQNDQFRHQKFLVELKIGQGKQIQQFFDEKYHKMFLTTIGVPHLILFLSQDQFRQTNFQEEGKRLQKNFDANINFCFIELNGQMRVKTFERGAGITLSCGTGVSSAVYVAVTQKIIQQSVVKTITDGGQIFIEVNQKNEVIMKGPAQIICQGEFIC